MLVVQSKYQETFGYTPAGTIARGLVVFTGPIVGVMFPKIVRSAAQSQSSSLLAQALGATRLLACGGALFCTLFIWAFMLVIKNPDPHFRVFLPIFTWAMVPL